MLADRRRVRDTIHTLSDEDLVALVTDEIARRPNLRPVRDDVTALLSLSPALAIIRHSTLANPSAAAVARSRVITSAARALVDTYEMLDSTAVSRILGKASTSRNTASRLARAGTVIALPVGAQKLYPAFQFDVDRQHVRPTVAEINLLIDAKGDPWGAASWWLNPTAFADDPRSPADLAVDGNHEQDLRDMVEDLLQG